MIIQSFKLQLDMQVVVTTSSRNLEVYRIHTGHNFEWSRLPMDGSYCAIDNFKITLFKTLRTLNSFLMISISAWSL